MRFRNDHGGWQHEDTSWAWWVLALLTVLLVVVLCAWVPAESATLRYIDGSRPCPGDGSDAMPHCTIQAAVDAAQCGDVLRIRPMPSPYTEMVRVSRPSCPPEVPVILEPERYLEVRWRPQKTRTSEVAALRLTDIDGWIVRGLTLEGSPEQPRYAVIVEARTRTVAHVQVLGNTVVAWNLLTRYANSAPLLLQGHQSGRHVVGARVVGNTVDGFRSHGMGFFSVVGSTIAYNTLRFGRCGPSDPGQASPLILTGMTFGNQTSSATAQTFGNTVHHNRLEEFWAAQECLQELASEGAHVASVYGVVCDVGASDTVMRHNLLRNIGQRGVGNTWGLWIEARCNRWQVHDNTFEAVGGTAVAIYGNNADVRLERNLLSRPARYCVSLGPGPASQGPARRRTLRGNACVDPGIAPTLVQTDLEAEGSVMTGNSWQPPP